jgi:hypothetical protein
MLVVNISQLHDFGHHLQVFEVYEAPEITFLRIYSNDICN